MLDGWRLGLRETRFWMAAENRRCSILIGCRDQLAMYYDMEPRAEGSRVLPRRVGNVLRDEAESRLNVLG